MRIKLLEEFYSKHPIRRITINNTEWEYIVSGQGKKTILIFPGGGQSAQANFRLIQALESKYTVIVPTIYSADGISEFCFAINTILERESVSKVILYGLSIGGLMAQSYLKRNRDKVTSLILSQCCTPKSSTYRKRVVQPLLLLNVFLFIVPSAFIKFFASNFAGRIQGVSRNTPVFKTGRNNDVKELTEAFDMEFREYYLTKRLLKTWINLHKEFISETLDPEDFTDWKGRILILRSDDDPLVQDEGDFKRVYPQAEVYTFHNTGHLAYYYHFSKMIGVITRFLIKMSA